MMRFLQLGDKAINPACVLWARALNGNQAELMLQGGELIKVHLTEGTFDDLVVALDLALNSGLDELKTTTKKK